MKWLIFFISLNLQASSLEKYEQILEDQNIKSSALEYVSLYLVEKGVDNLTLLKEKKIRSSKSNYRVLIDRSVKGFLGAYYNSNVKKLPFAYSFIINHSSDKVLKEFIKDNELNQKEKNIKKGIYTDIRFLNRASEIFKIDDKNYKVKIKYYLDSYKNFVKKESFLVHSKLELKIRSGDEFYFYITSLEQKIFPLN